MSRAVSVIHPKNKPVFVQPFYESSDDFAARLKREAAAGGHTIELRHEINMLREKLVEAWEKIKNGTFTGGYDKQGNPIQATDVAVLKALSSTAKIVAEITGKKSDLEANEFITVAELQIWSDRLISACQERFPDKRDMERIKEAIVAAGEPHRGL